MKKIDIFFPPITNIGNYEKLKWIKGKAIHTKMRNKVGEEVHLVGIKYEIMLIPKPEDPLKMLEKVEKGFQTNQSTKLKETFSNRLRSSNDLRRYRFLHCITQTEG